MWLRRLLFAGLLSSTAFVYAEPELDEPTSCVKTWSWIGRPGPDEISIGMWSHHFGPGPVLEKHDAIGVQIHGIFASSFINSHGDRCVWGGVGREWYRYTWPGTALCLRLGYRVGLVYGYRQLVPRIGRWTCIPAIEPALEWYHIGICFELVPADLIAVRCSISSF